MLTQNLEQSHTNRRIGFGWTGNMADALRILLVGCSDTQPARSGERVLTLAPVHLKSSTSRLKFRNKGKVKLMQEVILHIGAPKTGSTSIQRALKNLNNEKTRLATCQSHEYNDVINTLFISQPARRLGLLYSKLGDAELNAIKKKYTEALRRDLQDDNYDRLIISAEDIYSMQWHDKKKLLDFIRTENLRIKVIGYVRDPASWVASIIQAVMKNGMYLNQDNLSASLKLTEIFSAPLGTLLDELGEGNCSIYAFEQAIARDGSVVAHFAKELGIELTEPPRLNESLSAFQFALVLKLNEAPLKINGDLDRTYLRDLIVEKIIGFDAPDFNFEKLDLAWFLQFFPEDLQKECDWLSATFGIDYSAPIKTEMRELADYANSTLAGSNGALATFFSQLGSEYDASISIPDNFVEAYFHLALQKERQLLEFDATRYLDLNPDVKATGANPYQHYLTHGLKERRRTQ